MKKVQQNEWTWPSACLIIIYSTIFLAKNIQLISMTENNETLKLKTWSKLDKNTQIKSLLHHIPVTVTFLYTYGNQCFRVDHVSNHLLSWRSSLFANVTQSPYHHALPLRYTSVWLIVSFTYFYKMINVSFWIQENIGCLPRKIKKEKSLYNRSRRKLITFHHWELIRQR